MKSGWTRQPARWAMVAAAAAMMMGPGLAQAGYVNLSAKGKKVLAACNPRNQTDLPRCRVDSLPGKAGFTLVASQSTPLIKNEITIGTVHDQVWKSDAGDEHIFGLRVELTDQPYDLSGLAFNANDVFRQVLADQPAAVAYEMGLSTKALKKAGRTMQGLNEPDPDDDDDEELTAAAGLRSGQPTRNNAWVDFRIDANAAEPTGPSSPSSPWLLVKTKAPAGYSLQPFAVRVLSSDVRDISEVVEIYLPGYQPNPAP